MGNSVVPESLITIEGYIARAEENLAFLPSNVYSKTLSNLAGYLMEQSRLLLNATTV